jgi:hypothetical protein
MAAVSNNVQNPKSEKHPPLPGEQSSEETVEVALHPEVLRKVMAAAKKCGQTPGEWIHEAVIEAVEQRAKTRNDRAQSKH